MAKLKLGYGDVEIGRPLPFALHDEAGRILLSHGYVVKDAEQLDRLIERGVYFDAFEDDAASQKELAEHVSVYRLVVAIADEYAELLAGGAEAADLTRLPDIAREIQKLCALDPDPALACILLHKRCRYAVRHAFASALLTDIMMNALEQTPEARLAATTAALAMNLTILDLQDALYNQEVVLTPEQKHALVLHPRNGMRLLQERGVTDPALLEVVEDHHEMIDGSGYPRRKKAPGLGLGAQVVSLADRYCTVVSERAYRPATRPDVAIRDLLTRQAATIDTLLAAHFIRVVGIYPPGTVVGLANGEVAVVVRRTLNPTQPVVRSLRARSGVRYPKPPKRLTSKQAYEIKETLKTDHLDGVDLATLWPPIDEPESDTIAP